MMLIVVVPFQAFAALPYSKDFEDGALTGISPRGTFAIPPVVLSEDGNKFMRITASSSDTGSTPVEGRIRAQVNVSAIKAETLDESKENKIAYSYDFRYRSEGFSGITMQLFQIGPYTGYGKPGGYGPVVWNYRLKDNSVIISNNYDNDKVDSINVGKVANNTWHNVKIVATWSHNPAKAYLEFHFDNKLVKKITGRDICKGTSTYTLPYMDLGLYGGDLTNSLAGKSVDFDNIKAWYWSGSTPPPPAFNFTLSNGGAKSVTRGQSVTNSVSAALVSGTAQAVSFSISGLPSGVTGGFSPASCTPNCSSMLTLSASASAATGTSTVTVTAAGGGVTKTSAFTLTVNAPQTSTHSVTLSSTQAAPGAAFTATVKGGSGSVTQWVAVYLATAPDSAYSYKSNWKYLNGTKTAPAAAVATPVQLTFAAPPDAGVYNLRFFANTGTGTRLALSSNLTVAKAGTGTDLNGDGITNVADVQIAVNQALGASACGSGDVNKDGACNVSDIQLVINKALGL